MSSIKLFGSSENPEVIKYIQAFTINHVSYYFFDFKDIRDDYGDVHLVVRSIPGMFLETNRWDENFARFIVENTPPPAYIDHDPKESNAA